MINTIFRSLLALALLSWQIVPAAAMLTVTEMAGFMVNPFVFGPGLTFIACSEDDTDDNSYTFASHDVGAENADRKTIIGVAVRDNATSFNVTSLTVGGTAATEIIDTAGARNSTAAIYIIDNPTGTAENIVVNVSETILVAAICVWSVTGLSSGTATDTGTDADTPPATLTPNLDVNSLGVAVGICSGDDDGVGSEWTNMTERHEENGSIQGYTAADYSGNASAAAPLNVSLTGCGDGSDAVVVTASWPD